MEIRKTKPEELNILIRMYENARIFMASHGNPLQWGNTYKTGRKRPFLYKIKYKSLHEKYSQNNACLLFNVVLYYARKTNTKLLLERKKEDFFDG